MSEYEAAVDAASHEAEGLLEIFSALLRIAQVEGASPGAGVGDVDLGATTEAVADTYRPDAGDAARQLIAEVTPGTAVYGDRGLLTQAIANLVENALRYTPAGTRIGVHLSQNQGPGPVLAVDDDGPGVSAEDLPRLADRFHPGERSCMTPYWNWNASHRAFALHCASHRAASAAVYLWLR